MRFSLTMNRTNHTNDITQGPLIRGIRVIRGQFLSLDHAADWEKKLGSWFLVTEDSSPFW